MIPADDCSKTCSCTDRRWRSAARSGERPRRHSSHLRPSTAILAIASCLILLLTSLPSAAAASGSPPPPPAGVSPNTLDYVYDVSPSLFPYPANVSSTGPTSQVKLVSLPSAASPFGMINASSRSGGGGTVWFESGGYNPGTAAAIVKHGCATGSSWSGTNSQCPSSVPVQWNIPTRVTNVTGPVAADAIATMGSVVVSAVSSSGSTQLWASSNSGGTWATFGSSVSGSVVALTTNTTSVLLVTSGSNAWQASTFAPTGRLSSQVTLSPSGSGATGILSASASIVPDGFGSLLAVAFSVSGLDQIQLVTSTNGGTSFSTPKVVAAFSTSGANPVFAAVGDTQLSAAGWVSGQLTLVGVGSELLLAYPTLYNGQTMLVTQGSGNFGSSWTGPYTSSPVLGNIENLSGTGSPAGLVYLSWTNPDVDGGAPEEAIFYPDGTPLLAPVPIGGAGPAQPVDGAPSLTVDAFQRPLIAWPVVSGNSGRVDFTGDFLGANESLELLDQMVSDPLVGADFNSGTGSTGEAAFNSSVTSSSSSITTSLSTNQLCNAQNTTALSLYSELTHQPLNLIGGSGTVCASTLKSNNATSPLDPSVGVDAPNTYLAVYSDWLLEALAVPLSSSPLQNATLAWGSSPTSPQSPGPQIKLDSFSSGFSGCGSFNSQWNCANTTETVEVAPSIYGPTALDLGVTAVIPWGARYSLTCSWTGKTSPPVGWVPSTYYANYTLIKAWANVTINNGTTHSFEGSGIYPSVYASNLTPNQAYWWSLSLSPQYQLTTSGTWCGSGSAPSAPFTASKTSFSGKVTMTLPLASTSHSLHVSFSGSSNSAPVSLGFSWADCAGTAWWSGNGYCMAAVGNATITDQSNGGATVGKWVSWPSGWYLPAQYGSFGIEGTVSHSYLANFWATSRPGGWTSAQEPGFSYTAPVNAPAQTNSWSYSFTLTRPSVTVWGWQVSNLTATTADATWYATSAAAGSVTYGPQSGGANLTLNGVQGTVLSNGTSWRYTAELHGLEPWTIYQGTYGVAVSGSWYTDTVDRAFSSFQTLAALDIWESDLPYDSITKTGGGATIHWDAPNALAGIAPEPSVTGGMLTVWNTTTSLMIPVTPAEVNQSPSSPWFDALNFTLLGMNQTYYAALELNYSTSPSTTAMSQTLSFVYQRDTSGDGLTDLEKVNGWRVPLATGPETVGADVWAYSTNGLVNDYYEKAYDLDPWTVDTAMSHMLDLWNLTFILGPTTTGPSIPESSAFHLWWENGSNPFSYAQYPGGPAEASPIASDLSNISCTSRNCPGNSPYSSEVLWSRQALTTFLEMPGLELADGGYDWLRGVVSQYGGNWTLTVWGKLSWGANPLVSSTPGDGIPDGARVNPVYAEDLQINFANGGAELDINGNCGNVPLGSSFALRIWVNGTEKPPITELAGAYSQQSNVTGSTCTGIYSGNPVAWTFAVDNTVQYQRVAIQMALNTSSNSTTSYVPVNGSSRTIVIPIDMLNAPPALGCSRQGCVPYFLYNGATSWDGTDAWLSFSITAQWTGVKDPTFLWRPNDNSTLNQLPVGLQRYSGAQNFALVVVNASYGVDPTGVPTPWGSSYSLPLGTGLNNLLVPMSVLVSSPLGQALFSGKVAPDSGDATPPLLQTSEAGSLVDGAGSASLSDLACYWQNRAVGPNTSATPLCSSYHPADKGVTESSGLQLTILNATPSGCTINCGTVPTNPGIEAGTYALPALGAILALNATNTSMFYALLAGILDNSTGGVNGTFLSLTAPQLATLDLPNVVLDALANTSTSNTPIFGPPTSHQVVQHQNSCSGLLGCAAQAWNSFAGDVVSGFTTVAIFEWSVTIAPAVYLGSLVLAGARLIDEYVVQPATSSLTKIGDAIATAVKSIADWISTNFIKPLLTAVFAPILRAMSQYEQNLASNLQSAGNDYSAGRPVAPDASRFWSNVTGPVFYFAAGVAIALTIVFTVMEGLSLGAGFLVPIIVGILLTGAAAGLANNGGPAYLQQFQGVSPVSPTLANEWKSVTGWTQTSNDSAGWYLTALAALLGIATTAVAATNAVTASETGFVPDWTDTWGTVFGVLAIILAGEASYYSSTAGAVVSVGFDGVSLILDGITIKDEGFDLQNVLVSVMDGAALVIDTHTVSTA